MIQFSYDPQGGALCHNDTGMTSSLHGAPPARMAPGPDPAGRPQAPGRPGPYRPTSAASAAAAWGAPR